VESDEPSPQADVAADAAGPADAATESAPQRDKERTRAAILDAAAEMISERGSGVSLASIAARAGVSKGALTHHFPHRLELERALIRRSNEQFWDDVHALVDLSENRPGKLLRAYVRALTAPDSRAADVFSPSSLLVVLGDDPGMEDLVEEGAARWRQELEADGFDPVQVLAVRLACEGFAMNIGTPYLTEEERALAHTRLLELAEPR
jgi:AcrR family transcriptional regulator